MAGSNIRHMTTCLLCEVPASANINIFLPPLPPGETSIRVYSCPDSLSSIFSLPHTFSLAIMSSSSSSQRTNTSIVPGVDIRDIAGNAAPSQKRLVVNLHALNIQNKYVYNGSNLGARIRLVEVNVWDEGGSSPEAEIAFETDIQKGGSFLKLKA